MSPIITTRPVVVISPEGDPFAYVDITLGAPAPPQDLRDLIHDKSLNAVFQGKEAGVWRIPASAREYLAKSAERLGYQVERRTAWPERPARKIGRGWECPDCTGFRRPSPDGRWSPCPFCGSESPALPAGYSTVPLGPPPADWSPPRAAPPFGVPGGEA